MAGSCSCGEDSERSSATGGDEYRAEVFPSTLVLADETLEAITSLGLDGSIALDASTPQVLAISKGTVLLAGPSEKAPAGFLRYVAEVTPTATGVVLKTFHAPLPLAFKTLHVKANRTIEDFASARSPWTSPSSSQQALSGGAHASRDFGFFLFNGDGNPTTLGDQMHLGGALGGGFDYDLSIDTDWGAIQEIPAEVTNCIAEWLSASSCSVTDLLPEVKVVFTVRPQAQAQVKATGAAFRSYEWEESLADIAVVPKVITIGMLVFTVDLDVMARIEGQASGAFSVSSSAGLSSSLTVTYSSLSGGALSPPSADTDFSVGQIDVTLTARAKVRVGPRLALKLYGFMGPYAGLYAFAALDADLLRNPCYSLHEGAEAEVGFEIGADLPVVGGVELADFRPPAFSLFDREAASGACHPPASANPLPPGSGADAERYAHPTFTPWSRTYSEVVAAVPRESNAISLGFSSLTRAIDGGYLVAGTGSRALVKLDEVGGVVWALAIAAPGDVLEPFRTPRRTLPTRDAALLVTAEGYEILKLTQDGKLLWSERFAPPPGDGGGSPNGNGEQQRTFLGAAEDGEGGFYLAASYQPPGVEQPVKAWLLSLEAGGAVRWSKTLALAGHGLYPSVVVALSDGFVVAGLDLSAGLVMRAFAARVSAAGQVLWARRYEGCPGIEQMDPTVGIRTAGGSVVLAGRMGTYLRSFILALKPSDGSVEWSSVPWTGSNLHYMVIKDLKELPTTGFVAVGDYVPDYLADEAFVAGFDAHGEGQWVRGYAVASDDPDQGPSAVAPSLALTDDGGVFVASYTSVPYSGPGSLWAMKVYARDGWIELGSSATRTDRPLETERCALEETVVALEFQDLHAVPEPVVRRLDAVVPGVTVR